MEFGVQIYGCLDICKEDPRGFFTRLAEAGYTQIEPCICLPEPGQDFERLWSPEELDGYMSALGDQGQHVSSFHAFGNLLERFGELEKIIDTYGLKQVVINCPQKDLQERYVGFAHMAKELGKRLKENGIELWIHNGAEEIRQKVGSRTALEEILIRCEGTAGLQLDVGWAQYGGVSALDYMRELAPYMRSVHYKDMREGYALLPADRAQIALGKGCVDVAGIFHCAKENGWPQLVDQDLSEDNILVDLADSCRLLRRLDNA